VSDTHSEGTVRVLVPVVVISELLDHRQAAGLNRRGLSSKVQRKGLRGKLNFLLCVVGVT